MQEHKQIDGRNGQLKGSVGKVKQSQMFYNLQEYLDHSKKKRKQQRRRQKRKQNNSYSIQKREHIQNLFEIPIKVDREQSSSKQTKFKQRQFAIFKQIQHKYRQLTENKGQVKINGQVHMKQNLQLLQTIWVYHILTNLSVKHLLQLLYQCSGKIQILDAYLFDCSDRLKWSEEQDIIALDGSCKVLREMVKRRTLTQIHQRIDYLIN